MISPYIPLRARRCWIQSPSFHPRGVLGNARPKLAGPAPPPLGADPLPQTAKGLTAASHPPEAFCESLIQAGSSGPGMGPGPRAY